jgi:nucleotidyltransferase/DNA polymerase involved in DNA repair
MDDMRSGLKNAKVTPNYQPEKIDRVVNEFKDGRSPQKIQVEALGAIPGVGPRAIERLRDQGINNMQDFKNADPQTIKDCSRGAGAKTIQKAYVSYQDD